MEKYYPYPCERCGACCKRVDLIDEMKIFDRGDGVCKNLTADNLCKIYSERPPLCNGEYFYKSFYRDMTVAEFHQMMSELCEEVRSWELERFHKKVSDAGRTKLAGDEEKFNRPAGGGSLSQKVQLSDNVAV